MQDWAFARRALLAALLLTTLSGAGFANLFYSGYLHTALSKQEYAPGEALTGSAEIGNFETVAFNDGYLVLELVAGAKGSIGYPSQLTDDGIIFYEEKISAPLAAGSQRQIPFKIALPIDLKPGTYTLEAYYLTKRAPVSGVAHLLLTPVPAEFSVAKNQKGSANFPELGIVKTKTVFNSQAGPVGPPVEPGGKIEGKVFVKNNSGNSISGTVWAGLCGWDDTSCGQFLSEDLLEAVFEPGRETEVALSLEAPKLAGAYAIRIEARDSQGRLVSLYRNRAIVTGPAARIKKLSISTQSLEPGKAAAISLLLGASPDHYTKPDLDDFDIRAWIDGNDGQRIFEKTEHVDSLKFWDAEREFEFPFTAQKSAKRFTVCASAEKNGTTIDKYCFEALELADWKAQAAQKNGLDVKADYSPANGSLAITVCPRPQDANLSGLDIGMLLIRQDSGQKLLDTKFRGAQGGAEAARCYSETVRAEPAIYLLAVDDYLSGSQTDRTLDFSARPGFPACSELGGTLCPQGEACDGNWISAIENSLCCSGPCIPEQAPVTSEPYSVPQGEGAGWALPAAGAAVVVLIIIAGFFVLRKKEGGEAA